MVYLGGMWFKLFKKARHNLVDVPLLHGTLLVPRTYTLYRVGREEGVEGVEGVEGGTGDSSAGARLM
jgi:hypothetical protein